MPLSRPPPRPLLIESDWSAIKALFDRLLELPASEHAAALQAHPQARQREVLELLAQHLADQAEAGDFLNSSPRLAPQLAPGHSGQRMGAWELLNALGHGGMGEVWEARRADGAYTARAAVKVLRHGLNSELLLRRFAIEQQLLARLDHPNVARLLDAGRAEDGRPYFVLEYVQGQGIDKACDGRPLAQRLALFLQLADAVGHAHRNLLLHRDIKPGNVLVTDDGQVKLLDFGIAKALDPLEGDDTDATLAGERPFTPAYASPEQVRGEPVSTATDVYSMGVLLYVMLTGQKPYGRDALTAGEAANCVLAEPAQRPSELPGSPPGGADPQWRSIRRALRGDLDNILLKALAKPLADRYPSADAFADDLRAWLAGKPVSAHPPSPAYLAARFVLRHRIPVAAAAAALLALVGGLAAMSWQSHQTELARRDAERRFADVRQLANRLVFRYHDQIVNLPGSLPVREALLADAVSYLDGLAQEVGNDRALALELADAYQRVAVLQGEVFSPGQERIADAQANLDKALALLPRALGNGRGEPAPTLASLNSAADMWMGKSTLAARRGRMSDALQALRSARSYIVQARQRAPDDLQVMSRLATLDGRLGLLLGGSTSMATLGRLAEARQPLQQSLSLFEQMVARDPDDPEWTHQLAWAHSNLANWALLNGRYPEALQHAERTVELRDAVFAARPDNAHYRHQTATARSALASALAYSGQIVRALAVHDEVESTVRNTVATDTGNRTAERDLLLLGLTRGRTQQVGGQDAAARRTLEPLLAAMAALPSADDDFYLRRWRADGYLWLARASHSEDPAAALAAAGQALTMVDAAPLNDPENASRRWMRAQALGEQAQALAALGQTDAARQRATNALAAWASNVPGSMARWAARDRALSGQH